MCRLKFRTGRNPTENQLQSLYFPEAQGGSSSPEPLQSEWWTDGSDGVHEPLAWDYKTEGDLSKIKTVNNLYTYKHEHTESGIHSFW